MCKVICNISYRCGHVEPWAQPRACELDAKEARDKAIERAKLNKIRASTNARKSIEEAEKRSCLDELPVSYIEKVTDVALKRLDIAFLDGQMQIYHFEELLQIIIGLPFLDKDQLVGKFASKVESDETGRFGPKEIKRFYALSIEHRNFGDSFRKSLKKPDVLDEPVKPVQPVPTWVPNKPSPGILRLSKTKPAHSLP
ncbi:hypothetical protein F4803DRAFT_564912 [Xylaria telfairii]|nr:hypothetical protein F4803DRAFT_564912 [Xylaria telfairii]